MRVRTLLRDSILLTAAAAVGWWWHGAGRAVEAAGSSSSDAGLAFQFSGNGPQQSLAVYNPGNRTLYMYPRVGEGNSHVNCEYSLTIRNPGAAIDRQNCPVGDQVQQR